MARRELIASGGNDISRDPYRNTEFSSLPVVRFSFKEDDDSSPHLLYPCQRILVLLLPGLYARRLFCVYLIPGK